MVSQERLTSTASEYIHKASSGNLSVTCKDASCACSLRNLPPYRASEQPIL